MCQGEEWRRQMLDYIEQNILFAEAFFKEHIPSIKFIRPESSFLVWLDCRPLGLNHDDLQDLFVNKARLALNDGEIFDTALNPYATPLHQKECVSRGFTSAPHALFSARRLSSWQKHWFDSGDGNVELTDHEHRTAC